MSEEVGRAGGLAFVGSWLDVCVLVVCWGLGLVSAAAADVACPSKTREKTRGKLLNCLGVSACVQQLVIGC